jgi:hypothetical protein
VLRLVVGQALRLAGAGTAIGMIAAMLFGRLIESQLFGSAHSIGRRLR